jgi:hypothetical protein
MDAFDKEQQAFNGSPLDDENLLSGVLGRTARFFAVAKTKFNRAAELTNTSQPRESRQVKRPVWWAAFSRRPGR